MSTPPAQVSELAIEVKGCETVVLAIQATPVSTPEPTQPGTGLGRVEVSLVQHQDPSKPVTTIGSVILRTQSSPARVIPVAIATSGQAAGTGAADNVPAGQYTLELLPMIYFQLSGDAVVEQEKIKTMAKILNELGDHGVFSLGIQGHASVDGDADKNLDLSTRRAKAVWKLLEPAIDPKVRKRIYELVEGKGEPSGKQEVDPLDRKVEFVLVPARGT